MRLYTKEDDIYINIPSNMINNIDEDNILLKEYIRIYKNVEKLKEYIIKYLFEKDSSITQKNIGDLLLNIKSEENLDKFINYIDVDIHSLEEKFKNLNIHLGVNINEINLAKEEIKNEYVNNSYNEDFIVNKEYIDEIINCIKDENMYSLRQKSRYGSLNIEGKLKYLEDIEDFNEDEKGGMYSPILVIYRPAKYLRGSYILEDTYYVYIKRQPLNALINQEKLNEKGIDGMGSIIYKKLKHDLTNENLQEILAEIYIYANKNNLNFENIKLTDISSNRLWLTSERLKKEFKELRYYHKNLTQKIKDIYDSTGAYYTQLGGKYIFNDLGAEEDNSLSTMNMQMEEFYAGAKDADYIIYNSTIDGELTDISQLLEKSSLLSDFKAVKDGNVWCTNQNLFQETMELGTMIEDIHTMLTSDDPDLDTLTYMHKLK